MKPRWIYSIMATSLVVMVLGYFRQGALGVCTALVLALASRARGDSYFASRSKSLDLFFLGFFTIALTVLAVIVPSPQ
jgi:hypothetical protein